MLHLLEYKIYIIKLLFEIALHGPYSLQDDIDRTKYIYRKTGQGPKEDLSKLKIQALSLHLG